MEVLVVSISGERSNTVNKCSGSLKLLFPTLNARGLLKIEFPSRSEQPSFACRSFAGLRRVIRAGGPHRRRLRDGHVPR